MKNIQNRYTADIADFGKSVWSGTWFLMKAKCRWSSIRKYSILPPVTVFCKESLTSIQEMFQGFIKPILQYTHVENISRILEKEPDILFAYLFGSHAKNTMHKESDIDIAIYLSDSSFFEEDPLYTSRLAIKIEKALSEKKVVDLRVLNGSTIRFKSQVIKHGKLISSGDEKKRIEFETSSLTHYYDFKPYNEVYDTARKVRIGI